jgi:Leucine-rich repeat (LRR) protein
MMFGIDGTVTRIENRGFAIRNEDGTETLIRTLLPGKDIRVAVGDCVRVSGGPGPAGEWASSTASKMLPDGRWVSLRINPCDPPEPEPTTAPKRSVAKTSFWSAVRNWLTGNKGPSALVRLPPAKLPLKPLPAREFNSQFQFFVTVYDAPNHITCLETPAQQPLIIPAAVRWEVSPKKESVDLLDVVREVAVQQIPGLSLERLDDAGAECLAGLSHLRWLTLVEAWVTDAGLAHLSGLLSLQSLWIWRAPVSGAGLSHLSRLTELRELDLSRTRLTEPGFAGLGNLRQLQTLGLHDTPITDDCLAHLASLRILRELQLTRTAVTDAALAHLGKVTSMEDLDLSNTRITGNAAGLENLTELRRLNLNDTPFSDAGLARLSGLSELRTLNMMSTKVTDSGLAQLGGLTNLECLNLLFVGITDTGLATVERLSGLKRLFLSGARVTDAGLARLQSLSQLSDLDLYNTAVSDAGLTSLARLTGLQKLSLKSTRVSPAGLAWLRGALPMCQVEGNESRDPMFGRIPMP